MSDEERWLMMVDVDAVQSYLLSSIRLREVAGASQLLVDHDADVGTRAGSDGKVLFSAGGTAVASFRNSDAAETFGDAVESALRERTVAATLSRSSPQHVITKGEFGQALRRAAEDLEGTKRLGRPSAELLDFALARRCESCGLEAAVEVRTVGVSSESRALGSACLKKHGRRTRAGWLDDLKGREGWSQVNETFLAQDFNELTGDEQLAIIAADVDGVGDRLRDLQTETEYEEFSEGLKTAVRTALGDAIAHAVVPQRDSEWRLPLEVLYVGGDDVLVACRAKLALPLVSSLVLGFTALTREETSGWCRGRPLGMSAAVVIVGRGFPFRVAHGIADRLLSHTKRVARHSSWAEGAVDFANVTTSWADAGEILADRALICGVNPRIALHLTARPFRVVESGERSLGGFKAACEGLAAGFPRNKLFALREQTSASQYRGPWEHLSTERVVEESQDGFRTFFSTWRERVRRDPGGEDAWQKACAHLGVNEANGLWKMDREWRTPVGDLADGVELWGKT